MESFIAVRDAYKRIDGIVSDQPEEPEVMDLPTPNGNIPGKTSTSLPNNPQVI